MVDTLFGILHEGDLLCTDMGVALLFVEYEMAQTWLHDKGFKEGENGFSIEPVEIAMILHDEESEEKPVLN